MPRFEVLTQQAKFGPLNQVIVSADSVEELEEICIERREPLVQQRVLDLPPVLDPLARRGVKLREMLMLYRRLEVNIRTGAGLTGALEAAAQTTQSKVLAGILRFAREQIVGDGATLSDSLARYPKVFSGVALGLIRAGEAAGAVDKAMAQMRVITRRNYDTTRRIKKLLRYPVIVLVIAIIATGVILYKVVPQIKAFYAAFGAKLPGPTQLLIDISNFITSFPIVAGVVVAAFAYALWRLPSYLYSKPGTHRAALRLPLVGELLRMMMQANFTRTYAQLREAEIPLLKTLTLCRELDNNVHYRGAISRALIAVSEGGKLSDAFAPEEDIFSPMVVRTIRIEDTGAPPAELFREVIEVQDEDIDDYLERLDAISGPLMTILLAVIVGFVLIALCLPLFNLSTIVGG